MEYSNRIIWPVNNGVFFFFFKRVEGFILTKRESFHQPLAEPSPKLDDCAHQKQFDTIHHVRVWLKQRGEEREPHDASQEIGGRQPWCTIWMTLLRIIIHDDGLDDSRVQQARQQYKRLHNPSRSATLSRNRSPAVYFSLLWQVEWITAGTLVLVLGIFYHLLKYEM